MEEEQEFELRKADRTKIRSFFCRQMGFRLDELDTLYDTDRDLAEGFALAMRVLKVDVDCNDEDVFNSDEFGEPVSDDFDLDPYQQKELAYYDRNEKAKDDVIAERRRQYEEAKKKLEEKLKAAQEEARKKAEEAGEGVESTESADTSNQPSAETGSTTLVSDEEMKAAMEALNNMPDEDEE